jgi:hypothetical protein
MKEETEQTHFQILQIGFQGEVFFKPLSRIFNFWKQYFQPNLLQFPAGQVFDYALTVNDAGKDR